MEIKLVDNANPIAWDRHRHTGAMLNVKTYQFYPSFPSVLIRYCRREGEQLVRMWTHTVTRIMSCIVHFTCVFLPSL